MAQNVSNTGSSPAVIFNLKGFVFGANSKENDFVRCQNYFNMVGYLCRNEATIKNENIVENEILQDESIEIKEDRNIASYVANRKGSAGAFTLDKLKLNKKDLDAVKEQLSSTRSTVWTGVVSFTPQIGKEFCNSSEQAQKILIEHLPQLFEGSKLDFANLNVLGAYHVNTQHPHIHIVFWEKEPTRISSTGKLTYNYNHPTKKPYLPKECLSNFKFSLAKTFDNYKLDFWGLRDKIRTAVRDDIHDTNSINFLAEMFEKDKNIIYKKGIKQYGRLTNEEKRQIDKSVMEFINRNPNTRKIYELYTANLMQAHLQNIKLLKDNNMPVPERAKLFYDKRMKELRSRLGNEYLANMRLFGKSEEYYLYRRAYLPKNGLSSSNYMRNLRELKKPLKNTTNYILSELEKSVKDSVILFKNNLDKYFAELKAKGVELIYGEEEGQQGDGSGTSLE